MMAQLINIHFQVRNKFPYKIINGGQNMQLQQVIKNKIRQL